MARVAVALVVFLVSSWPAALFAQRAELAKARTLYNEHNYDLAIETATIARAVNATADAATIVLARAHLERYRRNADPSDLSAARGALSAVRASVLSARDRMEFLLALGESLFLEDDFGAAAEIFQSGLDDATIDPELYDALLDWWASAIDRQAAGLPRDLRREAFERVSTRMAQELAKNPGSATSSYWIVVSLRGAGNLPRAWDAAVAGWARARLMGERTTTFRADINRFVLEGIIPDRVRPLPQDQRAGAEAQFKADWELVKEKWKN